MPERSPYDTRFFFEYFYSGDSGLLRRLKVGEGRLVSTMTIHEIYRISLEKRVERLRP